MELPLKDMQDLYTHTTQNNLQKQVAGQNQKGKDFHGEILPSQSGRFAKYCIAT